MMKVECVQFAKQYSKPVITTLEKHLNVICVVEGNISILSNIKNPLPSFLCQCLDYRDGNVPLSLMSQNSKFNSTKQGVSFYITITDLLTDLSPDEY